MSASGSLNRCLYNMDMGDMAAEFAAFKLKQEDLTFQDNDVHYNEMSSSQETEDGSSPPQVKEDLSVTIPSSDDASGTDVCSSTTSPVLQEHVVHTTQKRPSGKMAGKMAKDKTCMVCGDKALGYNFNAVSCESCKAFFRRNAFKEIRGRCEGTCEVTMESRSYCKKCRLKKCFDVGMKRDLILNDKQKQQRRHKITSNRLRRMGVPPSEIEEALPDLDDSPGTSAEQAPEVPDIPEVKTHVIAANISPECLEGLDESSRGTIEELIKAFNVSFDCPVDGPPVTTPSNADFLNMADMSVRRLVKMSKQVASFHQLNQEDQIALLKGAVVEVLILRSAKMFDGGSQGWSVDRRGSQYTVSASMLQQGNPDSLEFFQQYRHFVCSVLECTRKDNIILMFLIIMAVLSPDRANIVNKPDVAKAQEQYAICLKEYINHRYPDDNHMFAKVLQKLADIRDLNEAHTRMLLHMRVDQLEPLIMEIFDLSS